MQAAAERSNHLLFSVPFLHCLGYTMRTFLDFFRKTEQIEPDVLNSLSDLALKIGRFKYFLAKLARFGKNLA